MEVQLAAADQMKLCEQNFGLCLHRLRFLDSAGGVECTIFESLVGLTSAFDELYVAEHERRLMNFLSEFLGRNLPSEFEHLGVSNDMRKLIFVLSPDQDPTRLTPS